MAAMSNASETPEDRACHTIQTVAGVTHDLKSVLFVNQGERHSYASKMQMMTPNARSGLDSCTLNL